MYKVKLKLEYKQENHALQPYSIIVSYINPVTNDKNTDEFRNERTESKLKFLKRMIKTFNDTENLTNIIKSNIIRRINLKNEIDLEQQLINELNNMSIELDINIKNQ